MHDIITSTLGGFSLGPLNYIAKRAARGFDRLTDEAAEELAGNYRAAQSKPSVKVPVSNPRANPAYAAQVFSPEYIDRMIKAQVTGQPVMLPEVVVTAPRINNRPAPAYDTNTL